MVLEHLTKIYRVVKVITKFLAIFCILISNLALAEPLKIGVPLALTGDLAQCGIEMKNALILANEIFGNGKYELLIQDDKCSNKESISIARKFIDQDKVQYAVGFMCNQTLIASAPVYDRAGIFVFSGSGTSGDIHSLGKKNFRFFPTDLFGATRLFKYLNGRIKSLAILSEQTDYTVMMERTFKRENEKAGNPISIQSYEFSHSITDLRTLLLKIKLSSVDALYINADSDVSYINIIKQLSVLGYSKPIYTVYLAGSEVALSTAPALNNTVVFSNLPKVNALFSEQGKNILEQYSKRFGKPICGYPVVPTTLESFRVLDLLISRKITEDELRSGKKITDGILPPYSFDDGGNIQGFEFEMQHIVNGKVELLEK
jgi:ABC-type branched-subunit amino acid transport system substrate-binding protein